MGIWLFCFALAAIVVGMAKLAFRFLSWPGAVPLLFAMAIFFDHIWPHLQHSLQQPYPETITVTKARIDWLLLPTDELPGEHWFTLTIKSTYERPYKAQAAICSIKGPVFYAESQGGLYEYVGAKEGYLGERRLLVSLFPASETRLSESDYYPPTIKPAERSWFGIGRPEPTEQKVIYFSTTPADFIGMLDRIEWCKVGEDRRQLAHQLGLTLDEHGVILGERVTWIGDHADFSVDQLVDRRVGPELLDLVP